MIEFCSYKTTLFISKTCKYLNPCKRIQLRSIYTTNKFNQNDSNFEGLDGSSPCLAKSLGGAEPSYQFANTGYRTYKHEKPFKMRNGILPEIQIAYETYGTLNSSKDNAILLFTGLSANSHAKSHETNSKPGWWEDFIGVGHAIDTNEFFIVCCNHIGSCFGSTGPAAKNPLTGEPYGGTFPIITVHDMIDAQFLVLEHLGVKKLHAAIGSSLGGMCSILAGIRYSDMVSRIIAISSCLKATPTSIAMRYLQRKAIMLDPSWNNGFYYSSEYPLRGIKLAREIATVTYRSGPEWNIRFGRKRVDDNQKITLCPSFEIENYLDYQGTSFQNKYDPNSLLYLSKAMDLYDPSEDYKDMNEALSRIKCPVMIMGSQTDILFPVSQQRELAKLLKDSGNNSVTYFEMDSLYGHDTFLLNINDVGTAMKGFLETQLPNTGDLSKSTKK